MEIIKNKIYKHFKGNLYLVVDILFSALSSMNAIIRLLPEIVEDATPIFTAKLCAVTRLSEEINM